MAGMFSPTESGNKTSGVKPTGCTIKINGGLYRQDSGSTVVKKATRSAYVKGQVVNIGGKPYRKPTSYFIQESEFLNPDEKYVASGWLWGDFWHTIKNNYEVSDNWEVGWLMNNSVPFQNPDLTQAPGRNEAVTKALNKLADQKAGLGEGIATLGQTLKMVLAPGHALAGSLKSFYRDKSLRPYINKSIRQLRREGVSREISNRYLEYVYGWAPLMSDIYGCIELAKQQSNGPLIIRGTGRSSTTSNEYNKGGRVLSASSVSCVQSIAQHNVVCKLDATPNAHTGLRALNQLGLVNPLSLAWDLTPWSFVFDWFVPVGPMLSALSAPMGLTFLSGYVSQRSTTKDRFSYRPDRTDAPPAYKDYQDLKEQKLFPEFVTNTYRRTTLSTWPLPGLWIVDDPFKGDRLFKGLALAISNIKR